MSKMKRVLNKVLRHGYSGCKNCLFRYNCNVDRSVYCCWDNRPFVEKYSVNYIYVENEKSSE